MCFVCVFEEGCSRVKVGHGVNGCVFYLMGETGSLAVCGYVYADGLLRSAH